MKRIEEHSIDNGDMIALGICTDYGTYMIYRKEECEGVSVLSAQVTTDKEQEKKDAIVTEGTVTEAKKEAWYKRMWRKPWVRMAWRKR